MTAADEVTVTVIPQADVSISADPSTIAEGETTLLSWLSANVDSLTIDQGIGDVAFSGNMSVSPEQTITYTISGTGGGRNVSDSVTVTRIIGVRY